MTLKNKAEIDIMRTNCKILAEFQEMLKEKIKVGMSTLDIDKIADEFITKKGGYPGFKGYNGFPNAVCASVNEQVIHGIPNNRPISDGDIVSIDVGILKNDFWGDTAYTYRVGNVSEKKDTLCRVTEEALYLGIKEAIVGERLFNVGNAVQTYAESFGFSVVKEFVGHGIGRNLWEKPKVPNYGKRGFGARLKKGLCIAIEPMINIGGEGVKILEDGWTVITRDGKASAHYEHTIAITEDGPEILSRI